MAGTKGEGTSSVLNSHGGHSHLVTTSPGFELRQTRSAIATAGQLTPSSFASLKRHLALEEKKVYFIPKRNQRLLQAER